VPEGAEPERFAERCALLLDRVEDHVARLDAVEQQRAALGEALRLGTFGHRVPHRVEVRLAGHGGILPQRTVTRIASISFAPFCASVT
jgi:hypothetical protein